MAGASDNISIGYGEAKLQAKGFTGILGALFLVATIFVYYIQSQNNLERRHEHSSVMEELRVITYIISQPEGKRPALAMPKSLQERLQKSLF